MAELKKLGELDAVEFLKMVKASKDYADLEKRVTKAGYDIKGAKLRLASFRKGGIVIPPLAGEEKKAAVGKTRKEKMLDYATQAGFKFDEKKFQETGTGRKKAAAKS